MFTDLIRPFLYLSIRHPGKSLWVINWIIPLALAATTLGILFIATPAADLFSGSGLFSKILGFIQNMPGFYLAALAAVATFAQPSLDKLMAGTPPTAFLDYNGVPIKTELTRRRFLSLMFGYLTAASFVLTFALIAATTFSAPFSSLLKAAGLFNTLACIRWIVAFVLGAMTFQLIVITFWGLYYLGERMHSPDG